MADVTTGAVPLIDVWRGGLLESRHLGHAVIVNGKGEIVESWGDPAAVIFPRSACKMIQALPLLETGAGDRLSVAQRALACASHNGAAIHVQAVESWLKGLGLGESDLRCGPQEPADPDELKRLICSGDESCQLHNNCSGKHAGFLTLNQHIKGDAEYTEVDHPLQVMVRQATEEVCDEAVAGYGIDGCSAPNFAVSLRGLAGAMARFANATESDARGRAMVSLRQAMATHPEMVAGEGRACTILMRAMQGRVAIKTGADGAFTAILPEQGLGIALKVLDGATRASEAAIVALLARLGVLDPAHPEAQIRLDGPQPNRRGLTWGSFRRAPGFAD